MFAKTGNATFDQVLQNIAIPQNIDPVLLQLWIQREKREFDKREKGVTGPRPSKPLCFFFASYLAVVVMIMGVLLGLLGGIEPHLLLRKTLVSMLVFAGIGFLIGMIAENCVSESARELVREVVRRSEATAQGETQPAE